MKRVLCALNYRSLKELRAIVEFGVKHEWLIDMPMASDVPKMLEEWRGDGIITDFVGWRRSPRKRRVQVVSLVRDKASDCTVLPDDIAIGRCAAEFFLRRGYRNFALCTDGGVRGQEFKRVLKEAGFKVTVLKFGTFAGCAPGQLNQRLRQLPKPCAIFCINDLAAVRMTFVLREHGFRIPSEFSILGVGNEELYCEASEPPLSSIDTRLYERGLRAAAELEKRMNSPSPPVPDRIVFPPRGVMERGSTDAFAATNPLLQDIIDYLRIHATEPVCLEKLAARFHRTPSAVYRMFRNTFDCSPRKFLNSLRLCRARRMLLESDLKISAVAEECGFPDPNAFYAAFRADSGTSPQTWRRNNRNVIMSDFRLP